MPRKKIASRSKKSKLTLVEQMITAFKATPAKIVAQFKNEAATIKQYENKVKMELSKTLASLKVTEKKSIELANKLKSKATSALRKQFNKAKKSHGQLKKTISALTTELAKIQKQLKTLLEKQTKFANLAKNMNQFEKQQPAKKTAKPKMAKKAVTKKSSAPAIEKQKPTNNISTTQETQETTTDEPVEMS